MKQEIPELPASRRLNGTSAPDLFMLHQRPQTLPFGARRDQYRDKSGALGAQQTVTHFAPGWDQKITRRRSAECGASPASDLIAGAEWQPTRNKDSLRRPLQTRAAPLCKSPITSAVTPCYHQPLWPFRVFNENPLYRPKKNPCSSPVARFSSSRHFPHL